MTQQLSPWLEGAYGWNFGEGGWNTGMDANIVKFSFMFDRNVDSIVASLPSAVNGQSHYLTTDNRLYFAVGTTYFSTVVPKWFEFKDRSTGSTYQFNGTSAVQINSPAELESRIGGIELTITSLGTAAFEDISAFATQAELDIVEATAQTYTDVLRQDLADVIDPLKGAGQVGRSAVSIASVFDLLSAKQESTQQLMVRGFHAGSKVGGGLFYYDATRAKSLHDGGTTISPTVPWDGTFATLAAFLSATGETDGAGFGCWVRIYEHDIHVSWFGAVSNDATKDNKDVLEAAKLAVIAKSAPNMPGYILPDGELYYSVSPNFGEVNGFRIIGAGADGCRLKYTGSAHALNFDPSDYDVQFRYGYHAEGFLIDAGPSAAAGLYLENIAHSAFKEVYAINGAANCILFDVRLGVLVDFNTCGSPINRFAPSSIHQETLRLGASPSKLQNTTACTFTNFIAEGASGAGIRLTDADCNVFDGGTSEANTGRGVLIGPTCRSNQFNGLALEANTVGDINDAGQGTRWAGGYATSLGEGVAISASARNVSIADMFTNIISIGSGAQGVSLRNVGFNHGGSGAYTDNGTDTEVVNLKDRTSGLFVYPKKARASITVGASPFTYTNSTGRYQNVIISAGTVTQVLYKRGGDTTISGQTSGMIIVAPGDELVVSYSSAPNMSRVPFGNLAV